MSLKKIVVFTGIVLLANTILFFREINYYHDKGLMVWFLDVGQGDSTIIRSSDGYWAIVDAGVRNEVLYSIKDVPQFQKIHFSYAFGTHQDADHIEGFLGLMDRFSIDNLYINPHSKNSLIYKEIYSSASEKMISIEPILYPSTFTLGCCTQLNILWPDQEELFTSDDSNHSSIVIEVLYQDHSVLIMGDADTEVESEILDILLDDVDILRVGHHGSKTSTGESFIRELSPPISVISVGKNNSYNHPHPEIVKRLELYSELLRTDISGNICYELKLDYINACDK